MRERSLLVVYLLKKKQTFSDMYIYQNMYFVFHITGAKLFYESLPLNNFALAL